MPCRKPRFRNARRAAAAIRAESDDGARSFRLENFPALLDQALHCLAFLAVELPSQTLTGLVQSFDVPPRFIQMIGDRFLETGRRSLLGHLRQRLDELRSAYGGP